MHLLVEAPLIIRGDTYLDIDGVFYVGPNGRIGREYENAPNLIEH